MLGAAGGDVAGEGTDGRDAWARNAAATLRESLSVMGIVVSLGSAGSLMVRASCTYR